MADDGQDPRVIMAVADRRTAVAIADWLVEKGVAAEVAARPMTTAADPLTGAAAAVPGAVEVRAADPEAATKARALLEEMADEVRAVRDRQAARAARTGTAAADCEDCGKPSEWPASEMGTTQTCPHCGGYLDVPDPDDDWADVDVGAEDDPPGAAEEP